MSKLKPGDKAPDFKGRTQEGKEISLNDFKGKKLVLYFYPKDDTPGCTAEACDLRDNYEKLRMSGYEIIGVSADSETSHQKFIHKYNLPFNLISDTDKKILNDYGAWGPKMIYGKETIGIIRTTFLINENGIIEKVIEKVDTKAHTTQILPN